ncbi:FAD-binding oxidoreductase [Salibaculum sp.]|uniref:FAD-binding oxidoreductase n=1 Tax=Salibaculum sp. TaxID=2855480 RepID=UPI002B46FB91|nr:FAD-binding oxidoreductase [Salibaculum sp.]HKL69821.1 FAD-binding oxidoreductase [Salibaculum sp.]
MLNAVNPELKSKLSDRLGQEGLPDDASSYLREPRGRWQGKGLVVAPATTQEVAAVVRLCDRAAVGIIPYGGGTGLVGGQITESDPAPVILSLHRMAAIRAVHPQENAMEVEAGAILADIQAAAEGADRLFPLSLASEGSARIGGLLATNAGGLNVIRYGNARAQCLGLEVVMADGTVWHGLSRLRKDNTGYDLRDLMIGAEGTLGIITAATLKLMPRPVETATALIAVPDPAAALDLLALAGAQLGETVSAFELIHRQGFDFLAEAGIDHPRPLDAVPEWCVLTEVGLGAGQDAQGALEALFAAAQQRGLARDGTIAQSLQQARDLWTIRESIPAANRAIGAVSSHDISLPLSAIPDFIAQAPGRLAEVGDFRINCFGHLGDGNLHYNVFPRPGRSRADHADKRAAVKRAVHDLTHEMGGSVSAEHGVGRLKVADLERYADPVKLATMRAIKQALDPRCILNPGAVLRGW